MAEATEKAASNPTVRRYRWPWFVLAAFIAAVALAVLWMSFEVERTRRIRDLNSPAQSGPP